MSNLTLSEKPHDGLITHIERYGGKLGVLELLRKEYEKDPAEFDEIGIKFTEQNVPTILMPGEKLTEEYYRKLMERYGLGEESNVLIRGSTPGDYRSLIDIIRTSKVKLHTEYRRIREGGYTIVWEPGEGVTTITPVHTINSSIESILSGVIKDSFQIENYAKLTGVSFSVGSISFGVIPVLSDGHIVVTEHPNLKDVFIEEFFKFNNSIRPQYTSITEDGEMTPISIRIQRLLGLLRKRGILDSNIAYSFELGKDSHGKIVIYQIRELCKKVTTEAESLRLQKYHSDYIGTILTTIPLGEKRLFEYHSAISNGIDTDLGNPQLGRYIDQNNYHPGEISLDPNGKGILTESYGSPTIGGHGVMRQAQYALQSKEGGIVVLGRDSGGWGSYIGKIERDFEQNRREYDDDGFLIYEEPKLNMEVTHGADGIITLKKLP